MATYPIEEDFKGKVCEMVKVAIRRDEPLPCVYSFHL